MLLTVALTRLEPAAPSVDGGVVFTDTVRRGTMVRQVRGPGTLVPEQVRWVSALTAGRVERILTEPGQDVTAETVLLELSNPEVMLQALEAERQLSNAEAQLVTLGSVLRTAILTQEAAEATAQAEYNEARRQVEMNEELAKKDLVPEMELARARDRAAEFATRLAIEQKRLAVQETAFDEQLAVQRSQVVRLKDVVAFHQNLIRAMRVPAGAAGVLRDLPLEEGQWVLPGTRLARVVQPGRLKAELRIPETQARDIVIGQRAAIDTRTDTVFGYVSRIDPAVENSSVMVDVTLEGELPRGARPDLSVDGTIEIERLQDVLYVGRPTYGQAHSLVGLFRLDTDGRGAFRVPVRLGVSSVNQIEIVEGLNEGDVIVLSDMSQWDAAERVRIR